VMCAPSPITSSNSATTANRFISMKVSTRVLTTENSGFNVMAATNGITLIAKSSATITLLSSRLSRKIKRSLTSAHLAQSLLRLLSLTNKQKW
jgi:hypothetical protein